MVDKKKKPKATTKHNIKISNRNKNHIKITINQPTTKTKRTGGRGGGGSRVQTVYIPQTQFIPQSQPTVLFADRPQNDLSSILNKAKEPDNTLGNLTTPTTAPPTTTTAITRKMDELFDLIEKKYENRSFHSQQDAVITQLNAKIMSPTICY